MRSLPRRASASQIRATMYGCEIVCPSPIGSAASSYARRRSDSGTNSSRGTRSIARSTFSSTMSRSRSCASTISRLRGARSSGIEVLECQRREIDDSARDGAVDPDGQDRDFGVAGLERAVAASAEMTSAGEVGELEAERGRDDQVAGVRIRKRSPDAFEGVGLVEERDIPSRLPAGAGGSEPKLLAFTARDGLAAFAVEDELRARDAVQPLRESRRILTAVRQSIHHAGPIRGGDDQAFDAGEAGLERGRPVDLRLPVVGADDDRIALEELVRAAGGLDQRADRSVAAGERLLRTFRTERVGGEVVVRQVVEEEVE